MIDWMRFWVALSTLSFPLAHAANRRFRRLPQLTLAAPADALPSLSIIIPARNEAENLTQLLPTILDIDYPGSWEVIVIDDGSKDGTAAVGRRHGVKVVEIDELPPGWLGKTNACQRGSEEAVGDWLLFIDADTRHHRLGPAAAVSHVQANQLDGLSLFPDQLFSGLADRLALMPAFAGLFSSLDHRTAMLNGQFILISKAAFEAIGGFRSVAGDNLEDVALSHQLREAGLQVPVIRGDGFVAVQMYRDNRSLWYGLARLGSGLLRFIGYRSLVPVVFVTATMSPVLAVAKAFLTGKDRIWALGSWLVVAAAYLPWSRQSGSARAWAARSPIGLQSGIVRQGKDSTLKVALLAPIGALFFQLAAVWGILSRVAGFRLLWRDRRV